MPKRLHRRLTSPDALLRRLEELVLAGSGEDVFEEVFKLLIAKLWDERRGGAARFRPQPGVSAAIEALLTEAEAAWPGLCPETTSRLRDEHLAVCVETLAPFRLLASSLEVLDAAFEQLTAAASKGAKGQYFTPRHVIDLCVRLLPPGPGARVCDPACGSGGFLLGALAAARRRAEPPPHLTGWDFDQRAVRVARALLVLAGAPGATLRNTNALLDGAASDGTIDLVLTNPPFAGEVSEPALLAGYALGRGRRRTERDALFVERCVRLLAPGGRAAIVLPHNKLGAVAWTHLREWVADHTRILGVIGLGRETFLPHTHQKAGVLLLERRRPGATPNQDPPVFFALSERPGKDSRGEPVLRGASSPFTPAWERLDHDFEPIVAAFERHQRGSTT